MSLEKEKRKKFQIKKRQRFRKNHRRGHRARARARLNMTPQTYGVGDISIIFPCSFAVGITQQHGIYVLLG